MHHWVKVRVKGRQLEINPSLIVQEISFYVISITIVNESRESLHAPEIISKTWWKLLKIFRWVFTPGTCTWPLCRLSSCLALFLRVWSVLWSQPYCNLFCIFRFGFLLFGLLLFLGTGDLCYDRSHTRTSSVSSDLVSCYSDFCSLSWYRYSVLWLQLH